MAAQGKQFYIDVDFAKAIHCRQCYLFLVMDGLCYMVKKASDEGLLQPLARRALQHRISLYADDVVIFLCPSANDIGITLDILQLFGDASGLRTNVQKSNGFPIQCSEEDKITIQEHLPCQLSDFPCKYLGVPLSLRKLTKQQVQPIIDRVADRLPGWKADLLTKAGRKILVQFVLTSMLVYLAMAMDLPPWALKAIDKIRRGFLWRGRRDAKGGHCLLAWPKVFGHQNSEALAFHSCSSWDGLSGCVGCGCRKLNLIGPGRLSRSKCTLRSKLSLEWPLSQKLAMARTQFFGPTGGCMDRAWIN